MSTGDLTESKHTKIFVGGISIHTTDDGFKKAFQGFGEITDSIVLRDPETNRSRGFGFVTFQTPSMVERVLDNRPITIDDREVEVKRAIPKEANNPQAHSKTNKVFIGGLPNDISEKELKDFFNYYGVINEIELIYKDGVFRGFGFITFQECDSVDKVIVDGSFDLRENGHKCRVSKAGQRTPRQSNPSYPSQQQPMGEPYTGGSYGRGRGQYHAQNQPSPGYNFGGGGGADSYYQSEYKGSFSYGGAPSYGPTSGGGHDSRSYGQGQSGYGAASYGGGGGGGGGGESVGAGYAYGSGGSGGGPNFGETYQYPSYKSEGGRGAGGGRGRPRYKPY